MARRFLTAEDVRRAGGREIVVEADTVVTPQALEVAQAAGITIRTGAGAYSEPPPDRGPDAATDSRTLPQRPEPMVDSALGPGLVVTAVGKNRPGVLAEITSALGQYGASVIDISQKSVAEYFHVVVTVELLGGGSFDELKQVLECLGGEDDYIVRVMHERVFRFMHRI
ncbi:MAG: ACT domain-containing protein [bacterium]|nr:ACT domain-containing protein [bacterium]